MRTSTTLPALALAFAALIALPSSAFAGPANYQVDGVHSSVVFRVQHLGAAFFYGLFSDVSGKVVLDEEHPDKSSVEVVVKAESVLSGNPKRDQHLKSPDFFNVMQFPTIVFKSHKVTSLAHGNFSAEGELSLLGVTKPLTVTFARTGAGKNPKGQPIVGAEATFTIKRSDFGMKYGLEGVSDEVRLTVSLEAVQQ